MFSRASSVMPTPSSATPMTISSPSMRPNTVMMSLPSAGMAWRTAFSTSGWMRNGGTSICPTLSSMSSRSSTRSAPKRAISNVK